MGKGTKKKRKGKKVGGPSATIKKMKFPVSGLTEGVLPTAPTPVTHTAEITSTSFGRNSIEIASEDKEKKSEKEKQISGFIFMCNQSTKLECYRYRVFGLPAGQKEVVEQIKPGAKLFLYDFESKLLYGIYEADSHGMLDLESSAFRGKFPAQVKFKIFKECLPLPESSLRKVIKDNYTGSKFKQELSGNHVRNLLSAFRPLTASSSPSTLQNYTTGRSPHSRILPTVEHHPIPQPYLSQQLYPRSSVLVEHMSRTLDHPSLAAARNYDVGNVHWSSYTQNMALPLRMQGTSNAGCSVRSTSTTQIAPYHHVSSWQIGTTDEMASHAQPTNLERHYHQLPLNREALYQDNMAAACNSNPTAHYLNAASVPHHPFPVSYHHLPLHTGQTYDNNIPAYDPAAPSLFTAASLQQQQHVPADFSQIPSQHQDNVSVYYYHDPASYSVSVAQQPAAVPGTWHVTAPISDQFPYSAGNFPSS